MLSLSLLYKTYKFSRGRSEGDKSNMRSLNESFYGPDKTLTSQWTLSKLRTKIS